MQFIAVENWELEQAQKGLDELLLEKREILSGFMSGIAKIEAKLEVARREKEEITGEMEESNSNSLIDTVTRLKDHLLRCELAIETHNKDLAAKGKQLEETSDQIRTLTDKIVLTKKRESAVELYNRLADLIEIAPELNNCQIADYHSTLKALSNSLKEQSSSTQEATNRICSAILNRETDLASIRQKCTLIRAQIGVHQVKVPIENGTDKDQLKDLIQQATTTYDDLQQQLSRNTYQVILLKEAIDEEQCPVCSEDTSLNTAHLTQLYESMNDRNITDGITQEAAELKNLIESGEILQQLILQLEDLLEQGTATEKDIETMQSQLNEYHQQHQQLNQLKEQHETVKRIFKTSTELSSEYATFTFTELSMMDLQLGTPLSELHETLNELAKHHNTLSGSLSQIQQDRETAHLNLSKYHTELLSYSISLDASSLALRLPKLTSVIEKSEAELAKLTQQSESETTCLTERENSFRRTIDSLTATLTRLSSLASCLKDSEQLERGLQEHSIEQQRISEKLSKAQNERVLIRSKYSEISEALSTVEHSLASYHSISNKLHSYNYYKKNSQTREDLISEITQFSEKLVNFDPSLLKGLQEKEKVLINRTGELQGMIVSKQQEAERLLGTLDQATDQKTLELYVSAEITSRAIKEQKLLLGALESSITEFHQTKISQLNSILKDLWQQTYKGKDIDTIHIKAGEIQRADTISYNYRLCFISENTELDMRGRCSAGQRMVASIVIRIALAEAFSRGRIVLVLDEPTTNMDQENADGVAEALCVLANATPRLQLIVITHDEKFSECVMRSADSARVFRVEKDKGRSSITPVRRN